MSGNAESRGAAPLASHDAASSTLVHLISGATGAGKTTYATRLEAETGGWRFSLDDWMARFYFVDVDPMSQGFDWTYERVQRCCAQARGVADRLCGLGIPVIIDAGLTNRAEREAFANWAAERGFSLRLHVVDAPAEERWARTQKRNAEKGASFALHVTREMFDFIEDLWQPPGEDEMRALNGLKVGG